MLFIAYQRTDVYNNLYKMKKQLESFVKNGGTLIYGVCDGGWKDGKSNIYIPGDVKKVSNYQANNYIVDINHPIVQAIYSDNIGLTNNDLVSNFASHISFETESLPQDTNVILENSNGEPTLIEYNIGKGKVIASGLTWEHNYTYRDAFGKKALDDLFLYALNLTYDSIDEEPGNVESQIELDKSEYSMSDEMKIEITNELTSLVRNVSGQVSVTDNDNNIVENLEQYIDVEMVVGIPVTYNLSWNVTDVIAGRYKVRIEWYDGEEKVGEQEQPFDIIPNGLIKNKMSLSESTVSAGTTVLISDLVENTSTNSIENELSAILEVKDSNNEVVEQYIYKINGLIEKSSKVINNLLETEKLTDGMYIVESRIYRNQIQVSTSSAELEICGTNIEKYNIFGKLSTAIENDTGVINYVIQNNSKFAINELPVKISVISVDDAKEKGEYKQLVTLESMGEENGIYEIETSEYEAGNYVVTLYAGDNYERILDTSTFTIKDRIPEYMKLNYALFASEDFVSINCCQANIANDIYAKGDFNFGGSILNAYNNVKTSGNIGAYGWIINMNNDMSNVKAESMKDYSDTIVKDIQESGMQYQSINLYDSTKIDVPTLCEGTTGAYCTRLEIDKSLVSDKDIMINCNEAAIGSEIESQVLCSLHGDITINATKMNSYGLIYAPNGTVSINVCELSHVGSIVAKKIKLSGSYFNINQKQGE